MYDPRQKIHFKCGRVSEFFTRINFWLNLKKAKTYPSLKGKFFFKENLIAYYSKACGSKNLTNI